MTISDPGHFALKNAIRAAIVVPTAFVLGLKVFGLPPMALFGDNFVASSNAACATSCAMRPVPVRAESLQADILSSRNPRSSNSSFGTMTTSWRVSAGLTMVCGEPTS